MSAQEIVLDLLRQLTDDVSLHEVARKTEFVDAVREGMAEIQAGERIHVEAIERELPFG